MKGSTGTSCRRRSQVYRLAQPGVPGYSDLRAGWRQSAAGAAAGDRVLRTGRPQPACAGTPAQGLGPDRATGPATYPTTYQSPRSATMGWPDCRWRHTCRWRVPDARTSAADVACPRHSRHRGLRPPSARPVAPGLDPNRAGPGPRRPRPWSARGRPQRSGSGAGRGDTVGGSTQSGDRHRGGLDAPGQRLPSTSCSNSAGQLRRGGLVPVDTRERVASRSGWRHRHLSSPRTGFGSNHLRPTRLIHRRAIDGARVSRPG